MTSPDDRWSRWLRNGRLASIAAIFTFIAWLVLIITWDETRAFPNEFTILTMAMMGSAFINVNVANQKRANNVHQAVEVLKQEMAAEQGRNTTLERRSIESEKREVGPSLHIENDEGGSA